MTEVVNIRAESINRVFMQISRRAETVDRTKLVETFVDAGPLFTLLSSHDHQIIYGRRGTGKTHALSYLAETVSQKGDIAVFLDFRTIGSANGLYADDSVPLAERATRLLIDTFTSIHHELLSFSIEHAEEVNLAHVGPILDRLIEAVVSVKVSGETTKTTSEILSGSASGQFGISASFALPGPQAGVGIGSKNSSSRTSTASTSETGVSSPRVQIGAVQDCLARFQEAVNPRRIWIICDEWSAAPIKIQPFLADLIRRTVFPVRGCTVKIGAIEHRTNFRIEIGRGEYVGIEVGADAAADVNMDDFMVFDHNNDRAKEFFRDFLFKHFMSVVGDGDIDRSFDQDALIRRTFTQIDVFDEFVRAIEGVPRDAINIMNLAAQRAGSESVSMHGVRKAATDWYQRDKHTAVSSNVGADDLLSWIIEEVIGERRARAFLLRSNIRHHLIEFLFDARVLHVLKKSIAAHDQPGVRYDVYKLDYGCYVELISTARAPEGLLPGEGDVAYVNVPPDDYRSIRRAILNIDEFEAAQTVKPSVGEA